MSGSEQQCPATMCPLIAPDGSPWTNEKDALCPGNDAECSWWGAACSTGGIQSLVEDAAAHNGRMQVFGPNKPRRLAAAPRSYDCPKAPVCRWQEQAAIAGRALCPPRDALARGLDPRVTLF